MMSTPPKCMLGVIVPADRPSATGDVVGLGEIGEYGRWLVDHGIDGVEVAYGGSPTDGSHAPESVWKTGRLDGLLPPARRLAAEGCGALAWACTCASFIGGLTWSRDQCKQLSRAAGLPATSTSLALLAALEALGADTVDLLSPYPMPVTEALLRFLTDAGIEVAAMVALDCPDDSTSIKLDLLEEATRFDDGLPRRSHAMLVPDTAVYSLDRVAAAEAALGRRVVAANQATLWHSLCLLGRAPHVGGGGDLFALARETLAEPDAAGSAHG